MKVVRLVKKIIKNALLVLIALAVGITLAEAAVRWAAPQQLIFLRSDIWRPDE
jgi:hypothetical protein